MSMSSVRLRLYAIPNILTRNDANPWFSNSFKEPPPHFVAGAGSNGDLWLLSKRNGRLACQTHLSTIDGLCNSPECSYSTIFDTE